MRTPVFVVAGFLDSGKTTLAKEILRRTGKPEEWLVLICEHGGEEYGDEHETIGIDSLEGIDQGLFEHLQSVYPGRRFLIEYNGTWPLARLYQTKLPKGMVIQNVTCVIDAVTAESYILNMGPMLLEQMNFADCFYFTNGIPDDRVLSLVRKLNPGAAVAAAGRGEGFGRLVESYCGIGRSRLNSISWAAILIILLYVFASYYVNSF